MAGDSNRDDPSSVASALSKVVSTHGHGFHYAVMRRAAELANGAKSNWQFDVAEFPVLVGQAVTHVDFVLRSRNREIRMVAECKRADPGKARWCFLRTPYTWSNARGDELVFECMVSDQTGASSASAQVRHTTRAIFNLAFELKTGDRGDGVGGRTSAADAATQVLRSMNGLINHQFARAPHATGARERTFFLPVIFTTADLWVSPADLGESVLKDGAMEIRDVSRVDWLWYNFNLSPALRHDVPRTDQTNDLSESLRNEYCRSVAVVNAAGVDGFLGPSLDEFIRFD